MIATSEAGLRADHILVLAPLGRDAELACEILGQYGVSCVNCESIEQLVEGIENGAGSALVTEEALSPEALEKLTDILDRQPKWSEFPIMIFTSQTDLDSRSRSLNGFASRANVTLVDRPIRINTLVSATRAVLRARQHQYEVRDLLEELEDRIRERDQFLAMLGHELRNPLYAIVLASEDAVTEKQEVAEKLEIIRRQSKRLQKLVDDLLDISRVTRGKIALDRKVLDLRTLVRRCVDEMLPTARRESRQLSINVPEEPVLAPIDGIRMEQVLINLIANSLKYTEPGGVIEVSVESDRDSAVLRVSDDGEGIEPELLPQIFELFAQAGTRVDVHQGGLGIGLTLVKSLVDLHGGTVEASSEGPGTGTRITIRLPSADSVDEGHPAEAADREADSARRGDGHLSPGKGNLLILLIEDNDDIRKLLASRLERMGHRVLEEEAGNEGVERALEKGPDVAIVDIGLPGLDGYGVARQIREGLGDEIYLIAVTGYGQPEDRLKALDAGFDERLHGGAVLACLIGRQERLEDGHVVARALPAQRGAPAPEARSDDHHAAHLPTSFVRLGSTGRAIMEQYAGGRHGGCPR
ncbi:MAG: hybrid sensor histidine kinase/response regulator [Acidobacteria bacterium]|nr:hybrid sensor histidine kinase/response regulator [Acidobacteriota bacterium]